MRKLDPKPRMIKHTQKGRANGRRGRKANLRRRPDRFRRMWGKGVAMPAAGRLANPMAAIRGVGNMAD